MTAQSPNALNGLRRATSLTHEKLFALEIGQINAYIDGRRPHAQAALKSIGSGFRVHIAMYFADILGYIPLPEFFRNAFGFVDAIDDENASCRRSTTIGPGQDLIQPAADGIA